jgi:hypothetical protein
MALYCTSRPLLVRLLQPSDGKSACPKATKFFFLEADRAQGRVDSAGERALNLYAIWYHGRRCCGGGRGRLGIAQKLTKK